MFVINWLQHAMFYCLVFKAFYLTVLYTSY